MRLDSLMPDLDATLIEHRVVPGRPNEVYEAVLGADFLEAVRTNPAVKALFAVRGAAERVAMRVRGRQHHEPPEPERMRLADLSAEGEWVRLDEDPPREIDFGVVGRFWGGETVWERIRAAEFASFDAPGFARIGCSISLRPYGEEATLVTYEARTRATDEASRRAFLRYWRVVSPFVGVVMRSLLRVIERDLRP
jgi:hypothetical protein